MTLENAEIWNLSALCRCCHSDGYFKSLQEVYVFEGNMENYAKMLQDTINVQILPPKLDASYTICDNCIHRLRDAYQFKQKVLLCEMKFEEYYKNELTSRHVSNDCIKTEREENMDDFEDDHPIDDNFSSQFEVVIKYDDVITKQEDNYYDVDMYKDIKCEEYNKTDLDLQVPKLEEKSDGKGTDGKKKGVKRKKKSDLQPPYDPCFEVHVTTDTGIIYSCRVCLETLPDQKSLQRHITKTHIQGKYKCPACSQRFTTCVKRTAHVKSVHAESETKCSYCDKVFYNDKQLKVHELTHTAARVFKCDLCGKDFKYKASLRIHLRGHYGTKKRCICHLCGHGFNDRANLNAHILTVHEKQRPFPCQLCPKTFTANKHLKTHMMKHAGDTPYICDQCPKAFYSISALKTHKLSHSRMKKYTCKVCRKQFYDKILFIRHIRKSHVGQRPFKCNICGKDFTCKYSMKRHVLEHSGIKRFECDLCASKFVQKGVLNRHILRKHGPPKEGITEKCDVCHKLVTDLKKHMLCHNNKRYACEFCDKSFSENNTLTRHKKYVHFGLKPHVCEFCDKKYVKICSLRNHLLKVHKIVSKIETDEDFGSAVAKFSIKNKKGRIKMEGGLEEISLMNNIS